MTWMFPVNSITWKTQHSSMNQADKFEKAVKDSDAIRSFVRKSDDMDVQAVINYIKNVRSEQAKEKYRENTTPERYKEGLQKLEGVDNVSDDLAKAYAKATDNAL